MENRLNLLYLSVTKSGDWDNIYAALSNQECGNGDPVAEKIVNNTLAALEANSIKFTTIIDDDYPDRLKAMIKPPFVLFYQGDISLLGMHSKLIGIVGAGNKISEYGKLATIRVLLDAQKAGANPITAYESAAEEVVIKAGVAAKCKNIIIANKALERFQPDGYLKENVLLNGGCVISDVPFDALVERTKEDVYSMLDGLLTDRTLVVTELGKQKSPAEIDDFARMFKNSDVKRFAVAHSVIEDYEDGCNELIKGWRGFELYSRASIIKGEN